MQSSRAPPRFCGLLSVTLTLVVLTLTSAVVAIDPEHWFAAGAPVDNGQDSAEVGSRLLHIITASFGVLATISTLVLLACVNANGASGDVRRY